jgi:hypothetical protein
VSEHGENSDVGPKSLLEALDFESLKTRNRMMTYIQRYHLARYPVDLLRYWWRREGGMPHPSRQLAFRAYKAGEKPRPLYKGPPHWPKLKVIEGGVSEKIETNKFRTSGV